MEHAQSQTPIAVFDEFLVAAEFRALLDFTMSRRAEFVATEVIGANGKSRPDHRQRRSCVLFELGSFHQMFVERLMTFLPQVVARLGLPWFQVSHVEAQLTMTNNGDYFRAHTDSGTGPVSKRMLTFVYFFHREPRGFTGGELRIYATSRGSDCATAPARCRVLYPMQNQVVFFASTVLHEIMPVVCPSADFVNSRFTVNGWLHR